jgi:hypothetical protein
MFQLQDAIREQTISDKLATFSTADLEREVEIRRSVAAIEDNLRAYDAINYEDKEFIDFDDLGRPFVSE